MILLLLACSRPAPTVDHRFARTAEGPVQFIALGDTGKGNPVQHRVARAIGKVCATRPCDFALLLGDNLYPRGMASSDDPRMAEVFTDVYGALDLDFHVVLGNHDYGKYHESARAQHQLDWARTEPRYRLPAAHYRFDVGDVGFWALDTDTVFWEGVQPQADWLDETLRPSTARKKIVFGHHPYRSNGKHGNAGTYEGWSGLPYASGAALRSLFEDHIVGRADLYLSGHDHNLQSLDHDGLELVVSGAGADARPLEDRGNTLSLGFAVPGFVWVEVGTVIRIAFFDETGTLLGERTLE